MITRFCRDCEHVVMYGHPDSWGCHVKQEPDEYDPVSGEPKWFNVECRYMRAEGSPCGPTGELYQRRSDPR